MVIVKRREPPTPLAGARRGTAMSPELRDFLEVLRTGDAIEVSDACDRYGPWTECSAELVEGGAVAELQDAATRHREDSATVANILFVFTEMFRLESPSPCANAALSLSADALEAHPGSEVTVGNACEVVVYACHEPGGFEAVAASRVFRALLGAAHCFTPAETVFTSIIRAARCDREAFRAGGGVELVLTAMAWPGAHRSVVAVAADSLRNDSLALARAVRLGGLAKLRGMETSLRSDPAVARVVRMLVARLTKEARTCSLASVEEEDAGDYQKRAAAAEAAATALLREEERRVKPVRKQKARVGRGSKGARVWRLADSRDSGDEEQSAPPEHTGCTRKVDSVAFKRRVLESLNLAPNPYCP